MSCICNGLQAADHSDRDRHSVDSRMLLNGCWQEGSSRLDSLRLECRQDRDAEWRILAEWEWEGCGEGR